MTFVEIFLLPFTVFKYTFALMAWLFLVSWIMMTDWYWEVNHNISERYKAVRSKKK